MLAVVQLHDIPADDWLQSTEVEPLCPSDEAESLDKILESRRALCSEL